MNHLEVAILRVLVKRHTQMKLLPLVSSFPDDCEDSALAAVQCLKLEGYITLSDHQPNAEVSIANHRRKEILQIIYSNIHLQKPEALQAEPVPEGKQSVRSSKYLPRIRTVAIASLTVFGLFAVLVAGLPATSTDEVFAAHQHSFPSHWNACGANNGDDMQSSVIGHPPVSQAFLTAKDCTLRQNHET